MKENLEYVSPELETVIISVSGAILDPSQTEQGENDDQCTPVGF